MGAGLALALTAAGRRVVLLVRTSRPAPPGVGLCVGESAWSRAVADAGVVFVGTPDSAIESAAERLTALGSVTQSHAVLHLSGLRDRTALAALEATGAALGSMHPLQAVAHPASAPGLLRGAYAAIEGDARARATARQISESIGMTAIDLEPGAKPAYHAAAALVSNYTVAIADVARRIAEAAGVPPDLAERMYLPLLRGSVSNVEQRGAAAALTGAIRRGDAETVAAHLAALEPNERQVYVALGVVTVRLARDSGLDAASAEAIDEVLRR